MKRSINGPSTEAVSGVPDRLPKLLGGDIEVGNSVLGLDRAGGTCAEASHALLREIHGLPLRDRVAVGAGFGVPPVGGVSLGLQKPWSASAAGPLLAMPPSASSLALPEAVSTCPPRPLGGALPEFRGGYSLLPAASGGMGKRGAPAGVFGVPVASGAASWEQQDWGRRFLPGNGGCAYIDLNHLELCLPEVLSARDHVACWHAMLRIARAAQRAANAKLPPGQRIQVCINNSDGHSHSFGSHLNVLVTRRTWDNIFSRRLHHLLFLASYQVSSIVFTGQGKVGSENGAPPVAFQLSQRADFFETLIGQQTTWCRPVVNSRDEALCGLPGDSSAGRIGNGHGMARLHIIFFDSTLSHVASFLKAGVLQIVAAMIEAEWVSPELIVDDPVEAVVGWSHDPTLRSKARLASGRRVTAVELQLLFLEQARQFVAAGGCAGVVPEAESILALWESTLELLRHGDVEALARRLDWALKWLILGRAVERNPGLGWDSPELKHLDLLYSSLDPSDGLYWACERQGLVETVVTDERIRHFMTNPPEGTRAWARAMLLRRAGTVAVEHVDWDHICVRGVRSDRHGTSSGLRTIEMSSPLSFTREQTQPAFAAAKNLNELVDLLSGGETERAAPRPPAPAEAPRQVAAASPCLVPTAPDAPADGGVRRAAAVPLEEGRGEKGGVYE